MDKAEDKLKELTEKQKAFCRAYIYDWNGTRAYKVAYPDVKTDNAAGVAAFDLLRNPKIQDYIEQIQKQTEKEAGVSRLMAAVQLKSVIFGKDESTRDKLKAIEDMCKLLGYNDPDKVDLTSLGKELPGPTFNFMPLDTD